MRFAPADIHRNPGVTRLHRYRNRSDPHLIRSATHGRTYCRDFATRTTCGLHAIATFLGGAVYRGCVIPRLARWWPLPLAVCAIPELT